MQVNNEDRACEEVSNKDFKLENYSPLTPHKYPFWIIYFSCLLLLIVLYSFFLFPKYFIAAKEIKSGEKAYQNKDFQRAIYFFDNVLLTFPSSKVARISLAKAHFATGKLENYILALNCLEGIKLEHEKWEEIKMVIPEEYQKLFKTEKA